MARSRTPAAQAPITRELALGLDAPRALIESLARSAPFERPARGRVRARRSRSRYFDTEGEALRRAGLMLRLQEVGGRTLQSIERMRPPVAGLFARERSEAWLAGPDPEPARVADPELAVRVTAACAEGPLLPVLETELARVTRSLACEGAEIEAAFDVGEVRRASGGSPIARVELSLRRGEPAALFHAALALHERHPELRLALGDETEAGAAAGDAPALGSRSLEIAAGATLGALLEAVLVECLLGVTESQAAALAGTSEGVHRMRIAIRRLRSALRLFRDELPAERVDALRADLSALGAALGAVRDLDVFVNGLLGPALVHEPGVAAVRLRALEERERTLERLRAALGAPSTARLFLQLGALAYGAEWRAGADAERAPRLALPALEIARELVARCDRRVRKAGRGIETLPAPALHRLRIRAKSARYAVELLAPLLRPRRARRYARRAADLQDLLGVANDAATAAALLERIADGAPERALAFLRGWNARAAAEARAAAPRAFRRLRRARRPFA